jgi:hypothetical protein
MTQPTAQNLDWRCLFPQIVVCFVKKTVAVKLRSCSVVSTVEIALTMVAMEFRQIDCR